MNFTIKSRTEQFRIKRMNAIETLAIRTNISTKTVDDTTRLFEDILERIEVQFEDDKWLPVKVKGQDAYFPAGIEEDYKAVDELIKFFTFEFLAKVFPKSNESK